MNVPVPIMDKTHPYQQVVVQYSLHKYYPDGTMKHFGGILGGQKLPHTDPIPQGDGVVDGKVKKIIEQIKIPHNPNLLTNPESTESEKVVYGHYQDLLTEFIKDI